MRRTIAGSAIRLTEAMANASRGADREVHGKVSYSMSSGLSTCLDQL